MPVPGVSDAARSPLRPLQNDPTLARFGSLLVALARLDVHAVADRALAFDTVVAATAGCLGVERVSIWLFDAKRSGIECASLYLRSSQDYQRGAVLAAADHPPYFAALEVERAVVADDAICHPSTSGFAASYLRPLGIGALLDAPIIRHGEVAGVICCEHVGGPRVWTQAEQHFAAAVGDITARLIEQWENRLLAERARRQDEQLRQAAKMEALGRLAGGVAHDMNNLLGIILGQAEVARDHPEDAAGLRRRLERIINAVEQGSDLCRQLLVFARPNRDEAVGAARCDAAAVVAEMQPMLDAVLRTGQSLHLDLPGRPLPARIGAGPLRQIVLNLALNARDAMTAGGTLTVAIGNTDDGRVRLRVADQGPGLTSEALAHLFEPFFTTKPEGQGTGLGLATVYGLAQAAKGEVCASNLPGSGAEFRVVLPAG